MSVCRCKSFQSYHQEHIKAPQIHNIAYYVGQERTLKWNQHHVQIVLLGRWQPIQQHHALPVPLEKHRAAISPSVNHVTLDSSPVQEHLVRVVLLERSLILEQHHVLHVLPANTATQLKPVAWLVPREGFQMPDQKVVNNVQ